MKAKLLFSLVVCIMASVSLFAQEPDGLSCETAIPVDTSFVGSVPSAGTYYYSASTYDLPMTCYFYPEHPIEQAPKIYVDFTCTPGVYDDPNIVKLLDAGSGWGIELPLILTFTDEYDKDYNKYYSLTIGESYRELMAQYNITYNVNAFVKVEAPCAGEIRMAPDTTFKSCVENSVWLNLPDTIITGFQREADSYVLPFADWKNDSIQFRWTGNTPVTVWIGETCDFEFKTSGSNCALDMFVLHPDAGNGENIRVFTKQEIADYISIFGVGGVYYLRTVCSEDGDLIVEKKPMDEAMTKAKALAINEGAAVLANDTAQVYYFPTTWKDNSMIWASSSEDQVTAYFSKNIHFEADKADANIIASYVFAIAEEGRELALSKKQMKAICDGAASDLVYVKFVTAKKTMLTPALWSVGPCAENADEILVNDSVRLQRNATSTAWRINIADWARQDVKLYWKGTSSNKVFLCDTCKGFTLNKTNTHVKLYKEISINSDGTRDTLLLTKDELSAVVQYADADGFLYFRFNNSAAGSLITIADVQEPEPTPEPEQAWPRSLVLDSMITVEANNTENVYYVTRSWANSSVVLQADVTDSVFVYFGKTVDFEFTAVDTNYLAMYPFYIEEDKAELQLSALQLNTLLEHAASDTIYAVFYAEKTADVTPMIWSACACATNSLELLPTDLKYLEANTSRVVYRVKYNQWQDYDVQLHWEAAETLWAYLADTCEFALTENNLHVLNYNDVDILPDGTMVIGENVRMEALDFGMLPGNGFLYFRFHSSQSGWLTTSRLNMESDDDVPTDMENVTLQSRRKIYCTPDGRLYIDVDGKRYTILGQILEY